MPWTIARPRFLPDTQHSRRPHASALGTHSRGPLCHRHTLVCVTRCIRRGGVSYPRALPGLQHPPTGLGPARAPWALLAMAAWEPRNRHHQSRPIRLRHAGPAIGQERTDRCDRVVVGLLSHVVCRRMTDGCHLWSQGVTTAVESSPIFHPSDWRHSCRASSPHRRAGPVGSRTHPLSLGDEPPSTHIKPRERR